MSGFSPSGSYAPHACEPASSSNSNTRGGCASTMSRSCFVCFGEIAEIIAQTKGQFRLQTKGTGDAHVVNTVWHSVGAVMEAELLTRRSCVVPNFFHASIKRQEVEFWDGRRTFFKPQLVLLPDFTSKFHFNNVLCMRDAHYHATVPSDISTNHVAALAGTDRYVVDAVLRDVPREVGKFLRDNRHTTLVIDIGVAKLEFRDREMRVKWSQAFLDAFAAHSGPNALVSPYDPPSLTRGAASCRFGTGCMTTQTLQMTLSASAKQLSESDAILGKSNRQSKCLPTAAAESSAAAARSTTASSPSSSLRYSK